MVVAGILLVLAGMLFRLAWVNLRGTLSVVLVVLAALLFLSGVFIYARNLRE